MSVIRSAVYAVFVSAVCLYLPPLFTPKLPPVWGGSTHKDFTHVRDIFRKAIQDGRLRGGSIAAYYKGEMIVDLWGGFADVEALRPWSGETITTIYSTSKLLGALMVAQLVEKGHMDYKAPVAKYWPQFGQHGKEDITVEMLLSHQAGLALLDEGVYIRDLVDKPEHVEELLARQKPRYKPGSKFGYHGLTFGLYVDPLVKKADPRHRNVSQILHDDIAAPLDTDIFLGIPKSLHHRMARMYPLTLGQIIWRSITSGDLSDIWRLYIALPISGSDWSALPGTIKDFLNQNHVNDPDKTEIGLTSYTGQATARGLARLCSVLANGGSFKGRQLFSPKTISKLAEPLVEGIDETFRVPLRYGPGTFLSFNPKGETIFGHPGFGAQIAFADPHTGLGFAYLTNHHSIHHLWTDPLILELQSAIYDGILQTGR